MNIIESLPTKRTWVAMAGSLKPNVQRQLEALREESPITDPPLRPIKNVQFGILSPDEIKSVSVCKVTESRVANPPIDTVYDERMGPSHSRDLCSTCHEEIRICPGHFGHIELSKATIHPMFLKFIVTILNCICLKCSRLKINREEIELETTVIEHERFIRYIDRLNIIVDMCSKIAYCKHCMYPYPQIREEDGQIFKQYESSKGNVQKGRIEVEDLRNILMMITNEDLATMGFQPQMRNVISHGHLEQAIPTFRPEWLILTHLPVLPPMSRPPANEGDARSDDDLTTTYTEIVKYTDRLKETNVKEMTGACWQTLLQKNVKGLFDNSDGSVTRSSGKVAKGFKERITGKHGHIRGKLMGKRVDMSARTVITADPNLRLNEVGMPQEIAETLSFPEKVTPRNVAEMKQLLEAGKVNAIVRGTRIFKISIANLAGKRCKLRYDDIVHRQLRDGDVVVFNRQPTLHRGSMMSHRVRVLPGKTFRLNLSVTTPYNADFDGRFCHQQGSLKGCYPLVA